jgi:hydrogenase 3 maturation protease
MLESLSNRLNGKVVILGVGNPLRGDDGAGPHLIHQLEGQVDATLLDCEEVPENFLGKIAENQPNSILIIDAIDLGMSPGAVAVLEEDKLEDTTWSTHHASLQLFINCLKADTGGNVLILGIQPKSTEFSFEISDEVKQTISLLQHIIPRALALKQSLELNHLKCNRRGGC